MQARVTATYVGGLFSKKGSSRSDAMPWDFYPELFEEEKEHAEEVQEARAQAEHKAQMLSFAARWNAKRK